MFFSNKAKQNPLQKQLPTSAADLKDKVKSGFSFLSGLSTHPTIKKYTDLATSLYGHATNAYNTIKGGIDHFQANKENYQNQANDLIDKAHAIVKPFADTYSNFKQNR